MTGSYWGSEDPQRKSRQARQAVSRPLLEFSRVTFRYPAGPPILDGFNWSLSRGEFCSILGPSGSGKTTLLYLAAGLRTPLSGEVLLEGVRVREPSDRVGLLLQDYGLLPWYTARRNIEVALSIKRVPDPERRERAEKWLTRLGLSEAADRFPAELSGGQRQRVALARQLSLGNELLLLDEPLSAVDELSREGLQRELFDLTRGNRTTTLMVTHSVEEAALLSTRVMVIAGYAPVGNVREFRTPFGERLPERSDPEFQRLCLGIREHLRT